MPELDKYFGSGKRLKDAIKCYGKNNFTKIILELFDTREKMFIKEKEIVNEEFIQRKDVYNLCTGGSGGDHWTSLPNRDDIKKRIKETTILNNSKLSKKEKSDKYGSKGENNPFYGKKHSKEVIDALIQKNSKYLYTIISPTGETFSICSLKNFCKEKNLNRDIFMKYINKGKIPHPSNYGFESRMNTIGWEIISERHSS